MKPRMRNLLSPGPGASGGSNAWAPRLTRAWILSWGTTLDFQVVDVPAAPGETFLVDDVAIHLLSSPVGVADERDASPPLTPSFSSSPLQTRASLRFGTSRRAAVRASDGRASGRFTIVR
jgi:hypothetical protein